MQKRYWLPDQECSKDKSDDCSSTSSQPTSSSSQVEKEECMSSRVQNILCITRKTAEKWQAAKAAPNYPEEDFIGFEDSSRFDAEDAFKVDLTYDQTLIGICPSSLKDMMIIVQKVREQRKQHLATGNQHIIMTRQQNMGSSHHHQSPIFKKPKQRQKYVTDDFLKTENDE